MKMTKAGRPTFLRLLAVLLGLTIFAGACGESETEAGVDAGSATGSEPADGPNPEAPEADVVFPVTITHKFGDVTIEAAPKRVVSIGFSDQDDLLALGITPVGIRDWYGEQPFATWPWAVEALGDAEPEVLPSGELNFEQIALLAPDLIVGVSSGMTVEDYDKLSQIAPTVAQTGDYVDYGMPWQERTTLIGQAVGQSEAADQLVSTIEERFSAVREANQDFQGATGAVAFFFNDQPGAYTTSDTRSRLMADLGFRIPADYDEIAGEGGFYASFSAEQIALLDVDTLVWLAGTDEEVAAIAASELRSGLRAAAEGREVFVDQELGGAFSFASPLSLNYLLDNLVPELIAAVDGDPTTPVPSAVMVGVASGETSAVLETEVTSDEQAAMDAWTLVFDSTAVFADKTPHLEDAAALETSNEGFRIGGESLGGISLQPSAAAISGDVATITYDVLFGENAAYSDLTGEIGLLDGTWVVSRDEYCGFLSSARTPCEG